MQLSKTGKSVPIYHDGTAAHSLYDPEKEAAQLALTFPDHAFIVFVGIGGAFHIRKYLSDHPGVPCAITESGASNLASLKALVDISDILDHPSVTVIPDCTDEGVSEIIADAYQPAIHGDFRVIALRSWQDRNTQAFATFEGLVRQGLERVSADYSVQSHFGKLWFRNIIINLSLLSVHNSSVPVLDTVKKRAVVAAAGPGLEESLLHLRTNRDSYAIFSTDTAYGTLVESGIIPDFFVSIDAQSISARHVMHPLSPETTVILDLCGNPDIALAAIRYGSPVIFASGAHPLARYASRWGDIPLIDGSSGTVTLAARSAAHALGFCEVTLLGADFAYVRGKPYARGTYLDKTYGKDSRRCNPAETLYASLMFRTEVDRKTVNGGITYTTAVLDRYSDASRNDTGAPRWKTGTHRGFPFIDFITTYRAYLERAFQTEIYPDDINKTLLPLMAWSQSTDMRDVIKLALELIARYTAIS
jgi:hypothetical protein